MDKTYLDGKNLSDFVTMPKDSVETIHRFIGSETTGIEDGLRVQAKIELEAMGIEPKDYLVEYYIYNILEFMPLSRALTNVSREISDSFSLSHSEAYSYACNLGHISLSDIMTSEQAHAKLIDIITDDKPSVSQKKAQYRKGLNQMLGGRKHFA